MLVVRVELHSAITGKKTELAKMIIANDGTSPDPKRGCYDVRVLRKRSGTALRSGRVEDYPRLSYNVWRLVSRALLSCFPEERPREGKHVVSEDAQVGA